MLSQLIKKSLIYYLTFLVTISTYAQKKITLQIITQPGISMGGEYDVLHASSFTSDTLQAISIKKTATFGVETGIAFKRHMNTKVEISFGLLYSHQGQNYKDYTWAPSNWSPSNYSVTWKRSVSLNYLKLPIQFEFISAPESKLTFSFSAGFYLAYLLNFRDEYEETTSEGNTFTTIATKSSLTNSSIDRYGNIHQTSISFESKPYNTFDLGGVAAVGIQFRLSDKILIPIMLNYQYGFTNAKNETSKYTSTRQYNFFWQPPNSTIPYHNSLLGLKMGIQFSL